MAVRLLVTRTTSPSEPDEYVFEQDSVTIGRDSSSHLILPDQRRIISKQHAEIRKEGNAFQLLDLGSKNFTFLHDERLTPGKPYDLYPGDSFKIGEFEIRFEPVVEVEQHDYDRTVFDFNFVNPFDEPVSHLAELIQNIRDRYVLEARSRRDDALREAFERAGVRPERHEADPLIARLLGLASETTAPPPPQTPPSPQAPSRPAYYAPPSPREGASAREGTAPPSPDTTASGPGPQSRTFSQPTSSPMDLSGVPATRLERVTGMLIRAFTKVAGIPWQFRHEFIGQTIIQTADSSVVYSGNPEALRNYLLDPSLPEEEVERRLSFIENLIEELALHQVALLDGYRASVNQGVQQLLDEMDPETAEQQAAREGGANQFVAVMRKARAAAILAEKKRELQGEDWSVAERRVFRPAFIKAYLARMTGRTGRS